MKCIVLQNPDGEHLGFMLCNPGLDQPSGDCVFMPLPDQPQLFGTPAAELLFTRREAGESTWQVTVRDPLSVVVRTPGQATELFIELDSAGAGRWGTGRGSSREVVGHALLAKAAEPGAQSTMPEGDGESFDMVDLVDEHIKSTIGPIEYVHHELGFDDPRIDVYYVAPSPDRQFHTFVTCGMSSRPMNTHGEVEGNQFAELMVLLPREWPVSDDALKKNRYAWPIDLLRSLARYPHENDTWFGIAHSIPNGGPARPLGEGVDWKAVLLLPPLLLPDAGQMVLPSGERVDFLCMVPLYIEELKLKVERGSAVLLDLFDQHGINELIRPERMNVARRRRWWQFGK